jgi:hypothetical protein
MEVRKNMFVFFFVCDYLGKFFAIGMKRKVEEKEW